MPVELFMTDFCPFAQRTWIAFLEKEADPKNPQLFNYREVNYFNPDLPETKKFLSIHNTVPAGIAEDGEVLRESMPMCEWVDAKYPQNPLQPKSDEGKAAMKAAIAKFTSGPFNLVTTMYELLTEVDSKEKQKALAAKLLAAYEELARDLQASGGPFLLGQQFTLADIALIPFVQRAFALLPHYKADVFAVPDTPAFAPFKRWVAAVEARPSVAISSADRLPRSVAVQPFAATKRVEYLREMYQGYGHGVKDQVRKQLRHAPPGKNSVDIALAQAEKALEKKTKAAAEQAKAQKKQLLIGLGFAAVVAVVIARVWKARSSKL